MHMIGSGNAIYVRQLLDINMTTQSEQQPYIKQMPKGECTYCDLEYDNPTWLFPPHTASPRCQSGHHSHCTCDICF